MKLVHVHGTVLVFAAFALASCRLPVNASDYDQTCVADEDCVVVEVGDRCDPNACTAAAIRVDELERYEAQGGLCWQFFASVAYVACGSTSPSPVECLVSFEALCRDGICVASEIPDD